MKEIHLVTANKELFLPYVIRRIDEACFSRDITTLGQTPSTKSCIRSPGNESIGWKPMRSCSGLSPTTPMKEDLFELFLIS